MKTYLVPVLIIVTLPFSSAFGQVNTQRGSVLGGLAGAAAGAAIGEHNDKPVAGALIGGAVGLVTGAALGNAKDRQVAQQRQFQYNQQQQRMRQQQVVVQQQQVAVQQQTARSVTPQDVISMTRSGLSESVIINHIQTNGVRHDLQVADVIYLHENGVSQNVITMMQNSRTAGTLPVVTSGPVYQTPQPVVVEQYVVPQYQQPAPRPYYYSPPRSYYYQRSPGHHYHH